MKTPEYVKLPWNYAALAAYSATVHGDSMLADAITECMEKAKKEHAENDAKGD